MPVERGIGPKEAQAEIEHWKVVVKGAERLATGNYSSTDIARYEKNLAHARRREQGAIARAEVIVLGKQPRLRLGHAKTSYIDKS